MSLLIMLILDILFLKRVAAVGITSVNFAAFNDIYISFMVNTTVLVSSRPVSFQIICYKHCSQAYHTTTIRAFLFGKCSYPVT